MESAEPVRRCERDAPGDAIRIDIEKLGRFIEIMPDERKESAVTFLKAALAYYASLGVTVTRVMTDNALCYKSRQFRNSSSQRAAQLPLWTHRDNWQRPHAGVKSKTPIGRLALSEDNLLRLHS